MARYHLWRRPQLAKDRARKEPPTDQVSTERSVVDRSRRVTAVAIATVAAVAVLRLFTSGSAAHGQAAAANRESRPKTLDELQRQSGHIWDIAVQGRLATVRSLKSHALRRAIEDHHAGKADLRHDIDVSWGEFMSGLDEPFLAIALDRPLDADLSAGRKVTLFGEIADTAGTVVASFEADDQVENSAGRALVDVSLPLPKGAARAVLGLAVGGTVRWLVEQPLPVAAIDRAAFGLSRPILSLDVHPLAEPQKPDDPFTFGGLRVAPRGDRTFTGADAPWLFAVVRVPGSTLETVPKLGAVLVLAGPGEGKTRRYPVGGLTPTPLRGFAGQWGLGIPLPVGELAPGEYQATLEVSEKPAGERATTATSFRVIAR
jgi:hypothetical protein